MANVAAAVIIASGIATRFDPLVMDAVVENRARWGQIDASLEVEGYVALLQCERLGQLVWIESPSGQVVGPVMVADCAQGVHREELAGRGWAVDLSWELAQEFGVVDNIGEGFTVWDGDPSLNYLNEIDRAADPLSPACLPANGAGGLPQQSCGPVPF